MINHLDCIPVKMCYYVCDCSFEKSPRHDAYVPKFEAELAQFCEKLVGFIFILVLSGFIYHILLSKVKRSTIMH